MKKIEPQFPLSEENRLTRPVVLIGMMGSGKTYAGKTLAKYLDMPFFDTDKEIEKEQNRKIAEIFEHEGEPFFRTLEEHKILELLSTSRAVISTGGGAVTIPNVLKTILEKSISIWLKADVETLHARTRESKKRPLLKNGNPYEILTDLLSKREPLYQQANIIVENSGSTARDLLPEILKELDKFLEK